MAAPSLDGRDRSSRLGYAGAIILSALGHAVFFALVLVILPAYFHHPDTTPPGYTVKIVDNIPAGDLGTHLPRLTQDQPHPEHRTRAAQAGRRATQAAAAAERARQRQDRNRAQHGLHPDARRRLRDRRPSPPLSQRQSPQQSRRWSPRRNLLARPHRNRLPGPGRRINGLRGRRPRRTIAVRCRRRHPCPNTARIRGPSRMKS